MRTITHGDVTAAARAIRDLPADAGKSSVRTFLERADAADRFRKRFGRAHPMWGNGSLMACVLFCGGPSDEPVPSDASYLDAMATVIEEIIRWRQCRK